MREWPGDQGPGLRSDENGEAVPARRNGEDGRAAGTRTLDRADHVAVRIDDRLAGENPVPGALVDDQGGVDRPDHIGHGLPQLRPVCFQIVDLLEESQFGQVVLNCDE